MPQPTGLDRPHACLGEGGNYEVRMHAVPKEEGRPGKLGLYVVSVALQDGVEQRLGLPDIPEPKRIVKLVQDLGGLLLDDTGLQPVPLGTELVPAAAEIDRLCELHGDEPVREMAGRVAWGCLGAVAVPIRTVSVAAGERKSDDGINSVTILGLEQPLIAVQLRTTPWEWFRSVDTDPMLAIPTIIPGVLAVTHSLTKPELSPDGLANATIERIVYAATPFNGAVSAPEG